MKYFLCYSTIIFSNELRVETNITNFSRNDIRITGKNGNNLNVQGFDQKTTIGYRFYYSYDLDQKTFLRFLYAPLQTSFVGEFEAQKNFNGTIFNKGAAEVRYKFNSYRLTYGRKFYNNHKWNLNWGVVGKVRDAFIEVRQFNETEKNSNVGFVPLLHLSGDYGFNENNKFLFDVEALAAPQGRAIDLGLFISHKINKYSDLIAGYRMIEGGADNDKVYNFSWINQYTVGMGFQF